MWRIVPALKGVGYAQVISVSYLMIFYNYIMALSVFYIFASLNHCLPWTECNFPNGTFSKNGMTPEGLSPAQYYWQNEVVHVDVTRNNNFEVSWRLVLCLMVTWIIVFSAVIRGPKSLGQMAYFTATLPFLMLAILLTVTLFQDGAFDGIKFFFTPELDKLKDVRVWYKATEQSFFSLSSGYGNIVMIASYNKFTNNVYQGAIVISILDSVVNLVSGLATFAVIGTLSHKYSVDIRHVVKKEGLGITYIVFPESFAIIKYVPHLWSLLFFLMLFVLGIGTTMSMIETLLTAFKDKFPILRKRKSSFSMGICALYFILGLPLTTNIGETVFNLLNTYGTGVTVFFYAYLEVVGVMWIYGIRNFRKDIKFMLNRNTGYFSRFTWTVSTPIALMVIFVIGIYEVEKEKIEAIWPLAVGWSLALLALVQIPYWFVLTVYRDPSDTVWKKIVNSFKPAETYGPSDPTLFAEWKNFRNENRSNPSPVKSESTVATDT